MRAKGSPFERKPMGMICSPIGEHRFHQHHPSLQTGQPAGCSILARLTTRNDNVPEPEVQHIQGRGMAWLANSG
ncbi:hypothetical protein AAHC03_04849 [Spirometra sp. Aus1]